MNIALQIFREKKIPILLLVLAAAVNMGLYLYTSSVLRPSVEELQKSWSDKRRLMAAGGGRDMSALYRQGQADLAVFAGMIPKKRDFARTMTEIFEIASNNNLSVTNVGYKPVVTKTKGDSSLAYNLTMDLTGSYSGVKSFLADMQRYQQMAVVDSITLNSAKAGAETVNLKMQLTLYLQREGE